MSTDIERRPEHGSRIQYAQALAQASLLPRAYQKQPANVLLAMEYGDALGIPPIQAIQSVHVIEGRPTASADLIASLVRKAGHKLRVTGDDQSATAQIIRADDPDFTFEVTWTMERAQRAGLTGKGVWKQYPAAMLKARAITEVARAGAGDALFGVIYAPEELERPGPHQAGPAVPAPSPSPAEVRIAEPTAAADDAPADDWQQPLDGSTPPEPSGTAPSAAQMRKMFAVLRTAGFSGGNEESRDAMLAAVADIIGREITSSSDMTADEVSQTIDALDDEAAS